MAVDAGPGRELLQREEEEEASRRARESQRSPVAGPPPLPTEQEEPSGPLPSAGPDSMEPGYVKEPWQPDRSEMEPEYGNLLNAAYTAPAVLLGASGISTAVNRTSHALVAEQASEDYYNNYVDDPDRAAYLSDLKLTNRLSDEEIADLVEEERKWLDGMRVSRPQRLKDAHYVPIHIEEGEDDDPYVRDHWAQRLTPDFLRTAVNEDVRSNPLVQANPELYQIFEDEGKIGLQRGADRFAELQRDYLYSYKSSPMVKAWVDWNESVAKLEELDPEWVEALVKSSSELGVGITELALQTLGVGQLPPGYTRAEFASEMGETLGILGAAGFAGAVTGNFSRSMRYNPSPLLVFLIPAVAKVSKGTASGATTFVVNQAAKMPGLGPIVRSLRDKFTETANIELPMLVREPGGIKKGSVEFTPEPGKVRPGELRPQRLGEFVKETATGLGTAALLGVEGYGASLMGLRAAHRASLANKAYKGKAKEGSQFVERDRAADDLETTEAINQASERVGRPARKVRGLKDAAREMLDDPASERTEILPTTAGGIDLAGSTVPAKKTTGEAYIGETRARIAKVNKDAAPEGEAASPVQPAPKPKGPQPVNVSPETVPAKALYEAKLGDDSFVSVVSEDNARVAQKATDRDVFREAADDLATGIDAQAVLDKRGRPPEEVASIESIRKEMQAEIETLVNERDRGNVQREPMAMRSPLYEIFDQKLTQLEVDTLSNVVQPTLQNLYLRYGRRNVDKAYQEGLASDKYGKGGGITVDGKIVEGSPLEMMIRNSGDTARVSGEWVAREKSKRQLDAAEDFKSGEEALGETVPEVVTEYRRTKDADPDAKPPVRTESFQRAEAAARARGTERLEGAIPVGEVQAFTRPGDKAKTKQYDQAVKRRKDEVDRIVKEKGLSKNQAELLYEADLKAEQAEAKRKSERTPAQASTERHNARLDGIFGGLRRSFSLEDGPIPPDLLYRPYGKYDTLPMTQKRAAEGKNKGANAQYTQRWYTQMLKAVVADIARDPNLNNKQRTKLLERVQRSADDSLFSSDQRNLSIGGPTLARLEIEGYKRGEIPIQLEGVSRPTPKKFVESSGGLRSVVDTLKKRLGERKINIDEYTSALNAHLRELLDDVKGIRSINFEDAKSIQAVWAELRGRTDDGKVRGPESELNVYSSRVGRWAIERIARMNEAEAKRKGDLSNRQTRAMRDQMGWKGPKPREGAKKKVTARPGAVKYLGEKGSLDSELRPVFNYLRQEIRNAEEVAASRPESRFYEHLQAARNIFRGEDVTGVSPEFVKTTKRLLGAIRSKGKTNYARLRKDLADAGLTRPEMYPLERMLKAAEANEKGRPGLLPKSRLKDIDVTKVMAKYDEGPKPEAVAKVGDTKVQSVMEAKPRKVSRVYNKRFVAKYREVVNEITRVDKKNATKQLRRLYNAVREIFDTSGDSLVLSDSLKRLMADTIVAKLGKGLSDDAIAAAKESALDWFRSYDRPMDSNTIGNNWSEAPGAFRLLNPDGTPRDSFVLDNLIQDTFMRLSDKDQKTVMLEAANRLVENAESYAAERGTVMTMAADRSRWGYDFATDTPLSAAIKMARATVLYNDANPLLPPSVLMKPDAALTKEMGTPTPVNRPTRIKATEYGEALRGNKQALVDDFNAFMKEEKGRELTKKELEVLFGPDELGISPDSKMGRFIDRLDNLNLWADEGKDGGSPMNNMLNDALNIKETPKKAKDEALPMDWEQTPFDTFVDPAWFDDVGWEIAYRKGLETLGTQATMYIKQKVTSESTLTNLGNTLSNLTAIALTTGEMPAEVVWRLYRNWQAYSTFKKDPKKFLKENPELGEAYMAAGDSNILTTSAADIELGRGIEMGKQREFFGVKFTPEGQLMRARDMAVLGVGTGIIAGPAYGAMAAAMAGILGPRRMRKYTEARRKLYGKEDNVPKLGEFTRHYLDTTKWLDMHEIGDVARIQTTRNGVVVIKKTGKGETGWSIDIGPRWKREGRELKPADLRKIVASYSARRTHGRIFNYADAPRIIKKVRSTGLIGVASQFMSYPYFAADLPGKPGLISGTILDNLNPGLTSTNGMANFTLANQAFSQGMRKTMLAGQVMQLNNPFQDDLRKLATYGRESGFNSDSIIWDLDEPNAVATTRTSNADGWKKSRDIAIMGLATLAWVRGEPEEKNPPKSPQSFVGKSWNKFEEIRDRNYGYFRNKIQTGETLQPKDFASLFEVSGTQMVSLWADVTRSDATVKKAGTSIYQKAVTSLAGAVMGVDAANIAKVLRGLGLPEMKIKGRGFDAQAPDPTHPFSAFRYEMETQRQIDPKMTPADEMQFMLRTSIGFAMNAYPRTKVILDQKGGNAFLKSVQRSLDDGMTAAIEAKINDKSTSDEEKPKLRKQLRDIRSSLKTAIGEELKAYKAIKQKKRLDYWNRRSTPASGEALKGVSDKVVGKGRRLSNQKRDAALRKLRQLRKETEK